MFSQLFWDRTQSCKMEGGKGGQGPDERFSLTTQTLSFARESTYGIEWHNFENYNMHGAQQPGL